MSRPESQVRPGIQPIRLLNPECLCNAVTVEGAEIETGIPQEEARTLLRGGSEWIELRTLQDYVLTRNRESEITLSGTRIWLSIRGVEIPDAMLEQAHPVSALLRRVIRWPDCYGNTTAHHIAADRQYLEFLSSCFFTLETLNIRNDYEQSPADWAAEQGNLHLLSPELLVPEIVLSLDSSDFSCVPWELLIARRWIRQLRQLHEIATNCRSAALANFITRVESLNKLKQTKGLGNLEKLPVTSQRDAVVSMQIPNPITLEWLSGEVGGYVNAKRLVNRRGFYKVHEEIVQQALTIPIGSGNILFHELCADRRDLQLIPQSLMTAELLLFSNDHGICPLQYAATEGALDLIPWNMLPVEPWHRHISVLRESAETDSSNCDFPRCETLLPRLSAFIARVERFAYERNRESERGT